MLDGVEQMEEKEEIQCKRQDQLTPTKIGTSCDYPCRFMIEIVQKELMNAYKEEEMFWRQKSRDKWLVFGDRSSKFFHGYVKTNQSRNHITKLKDKNNQDQWSDGAKVEIVMDYFTDLFKSSKLSPYEPTFESFTPKISDAMNNSLSRGVSKKEMKEMIFSINADIAPGPNGMTGAFFSSIGDQLEKKLRKKYMKSLIKWGCLRNGTSTTCAYYRKYHNQST